MKNGDHISQEDLALHAMQALTEQEADRVRLHLAECADCRSELAMLHGDLALVALSVEQHPLPAGARQRFQEKISSSTARGIPTHEPIETIPIDRRPARKLGVLLPWLAAAALLILAISLGFQVRQLQDKLNEESRRLDQLAAANTRAQEVLDVLTAPSAQRVLLAAVKTPAQPSGRAVYLAARGGLIFQASNLTQLAQDKTYELWVIPADGSAPIPAGLFKPDAAGDASVVLPQLPAGIPAKAFGVTIEKAGGSATPTAPILLSGSAPVPGE
ncbi:MAG: anti-sigma factor domain-containing protein [Terracidiphilus sp.]